MDKYEEICQVGQGACGSVYLVRNQESKKLLALKKIRLDESRRTRTKQAVQREARILSGLKHPHIVAFHESFFDDSNEHLCIIQAYCDGGTLDDRIQEAARKKHYFPEKQVIQWFLQVALAVRYMHGVKVLHRDLKASNVFLNKSASICTLGDFGIAKSLDTPVDVASTCVGTPCYLSPEMCQDIPYSSKADIWALGCMLYELLALRPAFDANNLISLFHKIVKDDADPIPSCYSAEMQSLVNHVLAKRPDERPSARGVLATPYVKEEIRTFIEEKAFILEQRRLPTRQGSRPYSTPNLARSTFLDTPSGGTTVSSEAQKRAMSCRPLMVARKEVSVVLSDNSSGKASGRVSTIPEENEEQSSGKHRRASEPDKRCDTANKDSINTSGRSSSTSKDKKEEAVATRSDAPPVEPATELVPARSRAKDKTTSPSGPSKTEKMDSASCVSDPNYDCISKKSSHQREDSSPRARRCSPDCNGNESKVSDSEKLRSERDKFERETETRDPYWETQKYEYTETVSDCFSQSDSDEANSCAEHASRGPSQGATENHRVLNLELSDGRSSSCDRKEEFDFREFEQVEPPKKHRIQEPQRTPRIQKPLALIIQRDAAAEGDSPRNRPPLSPTKPPTKAAVVLTNVKKADTVKGGSNKNSNKSVSKVERKGSKKSKGKKSEKKPAIKTVESTEAVQSPPKKASVQYADDFDGSSDSEDIPEELPDARKRRTARSISITQTFDFANLSIVDPPPPDKVVPELDIDLEIEIPEIEEDLPNGREADDDDLLKDDFEDDPEIEEVLDDVVTVARQACDELDEEVKDELIYDERRPNTSKVIRSHCQEALGKEKYEKVRKFCENNDSPELRKLERIVGKEHSKTISLMAEISRKKKSLHR